MKRLSLNKWLFDYPWAFPLVCFFPLCFVCVYLLFQEECFNKAHERLGGLYTRAKLTFEKRAIRQEFLNHYAHKDRNFFLERIQGLFFLEDEIQLLKKLSVEPAFATKSDLKKRLLFLQEKNQLSFSEQQSARNSKIRETRFSQVHPVEMGVSDLSKVLSLFDERSFEADEDSSGSPQVLITSFYLKKIKSPFSSHSNLYEVKMDLLVREFF